MYSFHFTCLDVGIANLELKRDAMGNTFRKPTMRVVSYNVKRWSNLDAVVETLAKLEPNVLCLNECCAVSSPDALERVAEACGLTHTHFFGHVNSGRYGNAILTREPSTCNCRAITYVELWSLARDPLAVAP